MYVSGFPDSPYGIEWMRFEPGSPISELVRTVPHVAFVVDDLDAALEGKTVLSPANSPSPGLRVAMIVDNGCPIELMEFGHGRPGTRVCRTRRPGLAGARRAVERRATSYFTRSPVSRSNTALRRNCSVVQGAAPPPRYF